MVERSGSEMIGRKEMDLLFMGGATGTVLFEEVSIRLPIPISL